MVNEETIGMDEDEEINEEQGQPSPNTNYVQKSWVIPNRMRKPREEYAVHSLHTYGRETQLIMKIGVELPSGRKSTLLVLIDTGAQVNLVRKGIFPSSEFERAEKPVSLITANGQLMDGGTRILSVTMKLYKKNGTRRTNEEKTFTGDFYDGDIGVDAILSYRGVEKTE